MVHDEFNDKNNGTEQSVTPTQTEKLATSVGEEVHISDTDKAESTISQTLQGQNPQNQPQSTNQGFVGANQGVDSTVNNVSYGQGGDAMQSLFVPDVHSNENPFEEAFKNQINSQPTPPTTPYYPPQYGSGAVSQTTQQNAQPYGGTSGYTQPIAGQNPTYNSINSQTQYTNHYPGNNAYSYYNNNNTQGAYPPNQPTNSAVKKPYDWNQNASGETVAEKSKPKSKRTFITIFTCICLVCLGLMGITIANKSMRSKRNLLYSGSSQSQESTASGGLELQESPRNDDGSVSPEYGNVLTIKQVYAKVNPSIVAIQVLSPAALTAEATGEGSGVIMSEDGYIITNAHVVANSTSIIKVILSNEEVYEAEIIGSDINTDLAVLKVDASGLTPAEFGDSNAIEIGDLVVAIGNPGGVQFSGSATVGYVSNLDRNIIDKYGFAMSCIQTDAAINPGNSGGALCNDLGQVIGITNAKIAATEYEGMGFAIPMHEAKPIVDMLMKDGHVTGRPMIGITYTDVISESTRGIPSGIYVAGVTEGTDAAAKGLRKGDIIHKINDTVITNTSDIQAELKKHVPGDTVTLTVFRGDYFIAQNGEVEEFTVDIVLGENTGQ